LLLINANDEVPAAQSVHEILATVENFPVPQGTQFRALAAEYKPAAHFMHPEGKLNVPAAQGAQFIPDVPEEFFPGSHAVHLIDPVELLKDPASHFVQLADKAAAVGNIRYSA